MGRNINSKSQLNVYKQNNYSKKGDDLKNKSLKHKEKIESSEKVKAVPVTDNLYKSDKKKFKKMIKITVGEYEKKFKHGTPRNLHKRGSKNKIRKLRKKHIRQKPDRKRLKNQSKIATPYGECCVCFESKEMSSANIIKCGKVAHVLCAGCKEKIKDNKCPLCRSHPIDPNKTQMVTFTSTPGAGRTDVILSQYYNIITNTYFQNENDFDIIPRISRRRTNLFRNHFQYM